MRPLDPRLLRYGPRGFLALSAAIGLALAGLVVVQAALLARLIARAFLSGAGLGDLRGELVLLAAVVLARAGLVWAQEVAAHRSAATAKARMRAALLDHAVRLGPRWLAGERSGELTTLATRGIDALDGYFARYLPQVVLSAVVPVAVLARIATADWLSALVVAGTLPLVPLFMVLVGRHTARKVERQWSTLARLGGHFHDVVAGLPTLKAFGRSTAQAETIAAVTDRHRRATRSALRVAFLSSLVLELLSTLSVALVAVSVGLRLVGGELALETGLLVLILAPEAYLPLRQLGTTFHASTEGMAAADQVFAVLDTPVPVGGARTDVPDPTRSDLRLEGVGVTVGDRPALRDVTFTVPAGRTTVLVGPSGAGKSTALGVLAGLVPPDRGLVLVGDRPLADLDRAAWWGQVAWLPQRPYLFAGSIAENVRLARPAATDAEVRAALRAAGADRWDPDTVLGDRGAGLSAGQRQRVALARVFLRDVPLVLLDEPTSHLDPGGEAEVLDALRGLARGRTVVVVAHRPALRALADHVVDLGRAPALVPA